MYRLSVVKKVVSRKKFSTTSIRCSAIFHKAVDNLQVPVVLAGRKYMPSSAAKGMPPYLIPPKPNFPVILEAEQDDIISDDETNIDYEVWAQAARKQLESYFHNGCGAVVLRSMPIKSTKSFNRFITQLGYPTLDNYTAGAGTREKVENKSFTASEEPPEYTIDIHSEMSYMQHSPSKVVFFCLKSPGVVAGGITPICDLSSTLKELDQSLVDRLIKCGVRYHRNIQHKKLADKKERSWQHVFHSDNKEDVENICKKIGYNFVWNSDESLAYSYTLPAMRKNPRTNQLSWFNQITSHHCNNFFCHPSFIKDNRKNTEWPLHTTYGDGKEFSEDDLDHMRIVQWKNSVGFHWKAGDVLVLDNLMVGHGRIGLPSPDMETNRKIFAALIDEDEDDWATLNNINLN